MKIENCRLRRGRRPVLSLLVIVAMALVAFKGPAVAQKSEDKSEMAAADFPKLVGDYLNDLHTRHPTQAATSGIHSWDNQLEDYSQQALASEAAAIKKFQVRLEKIPPLSLGFSDLMDYQILASNMKSRLLELEQIKSYERNPQIYSDAISNGLLLLAMFDFAPAEVRLGYAISKEKQVPRLIESARANVHSIPAASLKISLESLKGTLSFVQNDLPKAFESVTDPKLQAEFKKSTRLAADSIDAYVKDLERTHPSSTATFAIGKQNYEAKLKYDEGIDIPVERLLSIANRELAKEQELLRKTAFKVDPHREAMQVWAAVQADHPRAGTLIDEARKQLQTLVRFIEEKHIVTLLPGEQPVVAATPDFMRWSSASMWTPGPFEQRAIPARYLITDVDPKWTDRQKEEYLAAINYPQLWTTSIHEAYPGHFVQAKYMTHVTSVVRRTWALAAASFVEGWAHYTEQMM